MPTIRVVLAGERIPFPASPTGVVMREAPEDGLLLVDGDTVAWWPASKVREHSAVIRKWLKR